MPDRPHVFARVDLGLLKSVSVSVSVSAPLPGRCSMPVEGTKPGRLWWRLVATLTGKSFVVFGEEGERLIEPSSSWFPPQFPSGELELNSFYQESERKMR